METPSAMPQLASSSLGLPASSGFSTRTILLLLLRTGSSPSLMQEERRVSFNLRSFGTMDSTTVPNTSSFGGKTDAMLGCHRILG